VRNGTSLVCVLILFSAFHEEAGQSQGPHAEIGSCSCSIVANWSRRVWGKREWRWLASSGSGSRSCCGTRLTTTSSVVVDRSSRRAVPPVQGCRERPIGRPVTGRLIRLPCLPTGSSNNTSWSRVIEEMVGGRQRVDEDGRTGHVRLTSMNGSERDRRGSCADARMRSNRVISKQKSSCNGRRR
jgi:hypothetical protein